MKPMTCLYRLMLVAYIFLSSLLLLRKYNEGELSLSNWGRQLRTYSLKLVDCDCVRNTYDFL